MKKEKGLMVTLFYIISLINIGDSSFLITNSLIVPTQTIAKSDEPVCYIDDIYFTSVEKALQFADEDNSSNVINIIPNLENDVIISDSCTIGKGDVLCLPYEITNNEAFYMYDYDDILTYSLGESSDDNYFADYDTNHVNNNRVTNLKLLEDVKIYNEGTIIVGGQLGTANGSSSYQRPTGIVTGLYSQITMSKNSEIINNDVSAKIECYGYIKEDSLNNGSQIRVNSGTLLEPLVFYDYKGGTYTEQCLDALYFPLSIYDLPNVGANTIFTKNSNLLGFSILRAKNQLLDYQVVFDEIKIISSDDSVQSMFKIEDNDSRIELKFNPAIWEDMSSLSGESYSQLDVKETNRSTSSDPTFSLEGGVYNKTNVYFYGNCTVGGLIADIGESSASNSAFLVENLLGFSSLSTKDYTLPISYKFHLNLMEGNLSFNSPTKFLTGSSIYSKTNTTLTFNDSVSFYTVFSDDSGVKNNYPKALPSDITINGNAVFNSYVGGEINVGDSALPDNVFYFAYPYDSFTIEMSNTFGKQHVENATSKIEGQDGTIFEDEQINPGYYSVSNTSNGNVLKKNDELLFDNANIIESNSNYETGSGSSKTFNVNAIFETNKYNYDSLNYTWSLEKVSGSGGDGSLSSLNSEQIELEIPESGDTMATYYRLKLVINGVDKDSNENFSSECFRYFYANGTEGSCLSGNTLIWLESGETKLLKDLTYNDKVLCWDFLTGKVRGTHISIIYPHNIDICYSIKLKFENNRNITILNDHSLFDIVLNKFIVIDKDSVKHFLSHEFLCFEKSENGKAKIIKSKLIGYEIEMSYERLYSIQTAIYNNFIANGFLTITTPPYEGWFDYFEIGKDFTYDKELMKKDILKYGVFEYKDFKPYGVSKKQFVDFNGKYLKVLIGKGVVTFNQILSLFKKFVP